MGIKIEDYVIFYTSNGCDEKLLIELKYSILSARRFLDKNKIKVFLHPPYREDMDNIISDITGIADVTFKYSHLTEPFAIHPLSEKWKNHKRYYGEKINVREIKEDNVILLDCDTIVYKNPDILFEGDFDFAGLAMDLIQEQWQYKSRILMPTKRVFKLTNNPDVHMWAGAYLVFKNGTHRLIGDDWLYYFNQKYLLDFTCKPNRKTYDQSALIPAVHKHNLKIKILNDYGYIYNVRDDSININEDVIIIHGNNLSEKLCMKDELDKLLNDIYESQRNEIKENNI